jgi:hypothetical protein
VKVRKAEKSFQKSKYELIMNGPGSQAKEFELGSITDEEQLKS